MAEQLAHRGPDSAGEYLDGGVALAARRLSIIDLEHGDQPIANEDGSIVVVQNGEIYNYPELRRELERAGHRLRTRCDTEALRFTWVAEEHGLGFAERLRGMFAVAIWDAPRRRLVLACATATGVGSSRSTTGTSATSCDVRSTRAAVRFLGARSTSTRCEALPRFQLDPGVPTRSSVTCGSSPAGTILGLEDGRGLARAMRRRPPDRQAEDALRTGRRGTELVEELRARLRDRCARHLLSDVTVGVLLSGGVDLGTFLAALAAQETRDPVHTFTIGFAERSFDERAGRANRRGTVRDGAPRAPRPARARAPPPRAR